MILHAANLRLYSSFFLSFALILLVPATVSAWLNQGSIFDTSTEPWAFFIPIFLTLALGIFLLLFSTSDQGSLHITVRFGFLIVTTFWILAAAIGCLPFLIEIKGISFTDAYFESMSGFTTTGATILPDVESLGPGLALWRCMTQWLGVMGIIILFIAVLPTFGVSGHNLFRAEIPGGTIVERIKPRIAETAKSLWKVYLLLTVLAGLLLWAAGMPLYDAVCHSLTTLSTGGFSIKNQGVAAYDSFLIELIIIFFMLIAGSSFSLHYRLFHGENSYSGNMEFKAYFLILFFFTITVFATLIIQSPEYISIGDALRQAIFQVVSIATTTGFATTDYNHWPVVTQLMLLILMFIGGCTGSTGGSIKVLRLVVSLKAAIRELSLVANPRQILTIKAGEKKISSEMAVNISSFIVLFIVIFILGALCLTMTGMDMVSALTGAAAAIGNVGPGLGEVGPASTYASLTPFAKWVLVILMLLGRLELYTVLALLLPWLQSTKISR